MENDIMFLKKQCNMLSWFCTLLLIMVVLMGIFMFYMFAEFRHSDELRYNNATNQYELYDVVE